MDVATPRSRKLTNTVFVFTTEPKPRPKLPHDSRCTHPSISRRPGGWTVTAPLPSLHALILHCSIVRLFGGQPTTSTSTTETLFSRSSQDSIAMQDAGCRGGKRPPCLEKEADRPPISTIYIASFLSMNKKRRFDAFPTRQIMPTCQVTGTRGRRLRGCGIGGPKFRASLRRLS